MSILKQISQGIRTK